MHQELKKYFETRKRNFRPDEGKHYEVIVSIEMLAVALIEISP